MNDLLKIKIITLWYLGSSYANIGRTFGLSRCAVGGLCHRLGLRRPKKPMLSAKVAVQKRKLKRHKSVPFEDLPMEEGKILLVQLLHDHCRWPTGTDDDGHTLFCGCMVQKRSSYCPEHTARAWYLPPRRFKSSGMHW